MLGSEEPSGAATRLSAAPGPTTPGPTIVVERPESALARGRYAWPAWGILLLGASIVVLASAYLLLQARKRKRRKPS